MAPTQISDLLEQARTRILAAIPDSVAIYAFGSAVTDRRGPDSDLDLAVLGRRPLPAQALYDLARSLEVDLGLDVDLVDLMTVPTVLRYEVITRGRRIHCAENDVAVEFEGRSLAEHGRFLEDFAPLFDKIRESGRAYTP
jgi:predicted nucleotidyltransferase